ncbi:hypothetical protein AVEN_260798-1 [Araneus ventricosus]|uniref:Uncharacterized protein n=1 Tax=Araneus ventricosus TaxID=182803 RepID=A0A4Y2FCK6_ARAVE|nr:hypothetical protein AVEN_260798-1 [Araneus ventricosus]
MRCVGGQSVWFKLVQDKLLLLELNVLLSVTHRLRNHYQRDQNASRIRGSEHRRITTMADNRYLLKCARRQRTLTAGQLASQISANAGRSISRQPVSTDCVKEDC